MASSLELLGFELAQSLELLGRSLRSKRGVAGILRALGWEPPPGGALPGFSGIRFIELFAQLETTRENVAAAQIGAGDGAVNVSLNLGYAELLLKVRDILNDLDAAANSFATLPANYVTQTQIHTEFVPRLLNYVIVRGLAANHPSIYQAFSFLGVIQVEHLPADEARFQVEHDRVTIRLERLGTALTSPVTLMRDLFGWGLPTFSAGGLLFAIAEILQSLGARFRMQFLTADDEQLILGHAVQETDTDPLPQIQLNLLQGTLDSGFEVGVLLSALRATMAGGADGGVSIGPLLAGTSEHTFPLGDDWKLSFGSQIDLSPGVAVFQRAGQPAQLIVDLRDARVGTGADDGFEVSLQYSPSNAPRPLLVIPGGSRLEYRQFLATLGTRAAGNHAELFVEIALQGGRFVLSVDETSELLSTVIPKDAARADFDFALGFAGGRAYLRGSESLQATFPVHLSLGPVDIQSVTVGIAPNAGKVQIEVSATVRTTLGPLTLLIERVGLTAAFDFPDGAGGNLGPLNVDLGFKVPTGIGLALDTGPVSGGGYLSLDPAGQRYSGVLQLKLPIASVVAFGIFEQVQGQASFVAVLGIRFNPGVQLSFGFALTGVGGLVGMNRRANVDVLRERLASGAAGNVLFCEDPVKNAPTILGDLAAFFPAASDGFLVGPTLQISWLSPIVRLDIGIVIEFSAPSKIIILGSIRALLGLNETLALLHLRMDVLGVIDFEQQLISIDAALVNSHALGIVRLTGGMAFRLSYGNTPYILMSVGGFHPRFDPGPLNIPRLARIGASLDISVVVVRIYVRVELYVAFTSNTLQAGSLVEAGMDIGPLGVHGYFAFDALIQFRPFYFDLEYSAGFDVEVFGTSFCSVAIVGRISGPGPVVIYARGSVKLLFVRVSASATFELGESNGDKLTPITSPVLELAPELRQLTNLRTEGDDPTIVRRPGRPAVQGVLVSPKGSLIWEQKRAPLKTIIHRLGGVPLAGQHELHLDAPADWTPSDERDWFNPGSFTNFDLNTSQTLNNATFQELVSGLKIGNTVDAQAGVVVEYTDEIDLVKRPAMTRFGNLQVGAYLTSALHATIRERTTTPAVDPGLPKVVVKPETVDVHARDGVLLHEQQTPFQAFQLARQDAGRVAVPTTDVRVNL